MQMPDRQKGIGIDLTEGSILKTLLIYAFPLLLTNLVQQLYGAVDLMVIGHFGGAEGTVGVSNGAEMPELLTFIGTSFAGAGQIYVAQLAGMKDNEKIKDAVGTLVTLLLGVAIVLMVFSFVFCVPFLNMLNTPGEAMSESYNYMMIASLGIPFVFGYNAVCAILRGMGNSRRPLMFVIIAATANIFMDLLMVVIFKLGAGGTAIATVIAQFASFVAAAVYLYRRREHIGIEFNLKSFRIKKEPLRVIVRLGVPMTLHAFFIHISQLYCKSHINAYGLVASATNSVGNKINRFANIIMNGFTQGAGAVIGQNIGARKHDRVKKTVYTALTLAYSMCAVNCVLALTVPRMFFLIFTNTPEVIELGVEFMKISVCTFILSAWMGPFGGVVSGSGNARLSFIAGLLDGVVLRISISLVLAYTFDMGIIGFFWGDSLARLAPGILNSVYFFSGRWRTRKLLTES